MQMEKEMEDVILRAAAKHLGKKGGAIGSVKQREARRKNSLKGGRKRKYVYDMKVQAILGKKTEKMTTLRKLMHARSQSLLGILSPKMAEFTVLILVYSSGGRFARPKKSASTTSDICSVRTGKTKIVMHIA